MLYITHEALEAVAVINILSLMKQMVNNFSDLINFFFFQGNVPFRRVKSDEVLINRKLSNNSFEAKVYIPMVFLGISITN